MLQPVSRKPGLDPGVERFLAACEQRAAAVSIEDARNAELNMQRIDQAPRPAAVDDWAVDTRYGSVPIRIFRPAGHTGQLTPVVYLHGGGWTVGDRYTHDRLMRDLAHAANAAIVFVEYARSPEHAYPAALEQSFDVLSWVKHHGRSLGIDSSHLVVAGDSAGANLATSSAMLAKVRGGPTVDLQVLFCPVTDATFQQPSHAEFAHGYFLSREGLEASLEMYAPNPDDRRLPTVAPVQASPDQLRGLPPALIVTAEFDPLRDEGEAYARRLVEAGVPVVATRYLGVIHAFVVINSLAHIPAAKAAVAQAGHMIREVSHDNDAHRN